MFAFYQHDYTPPGYIMGMTPDGAACADGKVRIAAVKVKYDPYLSY